MKYAYPIILTPGDKGYTVYIPDFNINTQGDNLVEAIAMARDAIGLIGIDRQDEGEELPEASALADVQAKADADIVGFVDINFSEYRRKNSNKIRKLFFKNISSCFCVYLLTVLNLIHAIQKNSYDWLLWVSLGLTVLLLILNIADAFKGGSAND